MLTKILSVIFTFTLVLTSCIQSDKQGEIPEKYYIENNVLINNDKGYSFAFEA